ncbi:hypothetical protein CPT08_28435, partial [Klebsiella pneumoniae]
LVNFLSGGLPPSLYGLTAGSTRDVSSILARKHDGGAGEFSFRWTSAFFVWLDGGFNQGRILDSGAQA